MYGRQPDIKCTQSGHWLCLHDVMLRFVMTFCKPSYCFDYRVELLLMLVLDTHHHLLVAHLCQGVRNGAQMT